MRGLLAGLGTGGGDIARSFWKFIQNDIKVMTATGKPYAETPRKGFGVHFFDTNNDALASVRDQNQRTLLGRKGGGSNRSKQYVLDAFAENEEKIRELIAPYQFVMPIATLGKYTGLYSILPFCRLARSMGKLVIPVVAQAALRKEVNKAHHNLGTDMIEQLKAEGFRFVVILNSKAYDIPGSLQGTWDALNEQVARGVRALMYTLVERKQVDRSDLEHIFAGPGLMRFGYVELPANFEEDQRTLQKRIEAAVKSCFQNQFYSFHAAGTIGESLVCIQGPWERTTFGAITDEIENQNQTERGEDSDFNPAYSVTDQLPPPLGFLMVLTEYTGKHAPLELIWPDADLTDDDTQDYSPAETSSVIAVIAPSVESTEESLARMVDDLSPSTDGKPKGEPEQREECESKGESEQKEPQERGNESAVTRAPLAAAAPAQRRIAPPLTGPISLPDFLRGMNSGREEYLREALEGVMEGKVVLTTDDVITWLPRPQFDPRKFSERNKDWIYSYIQTEIRFVKTGTNRPLLRKMDGEQLKMVTDEGFAPEESRLLKLLQRVGEIYGAGFAHRLVNPDPAGEGAQESKIVRAARILEKSRLEPTQVE